MADKTWPFDDGDPRFAPDAFEESLEFDVEITTSRSGRVTTQALPGARWRLNLTWPDTTVAYLIERRQLEAFLVGLRGGADRMLIHNLLTPEPLGTMRGTVTLSATLAAGATTASITGGRAAPNLLLNSSFETDTNVDGLANGWTQYSTGTTGTVTPSRVAGNGSTWAQRLDATGLGSTSSDQVGVYYSADADVTAGLSYALSADTRDNGVAVRVHIDWYDGGASIISSSSAVAASSGSTWTRRSVVGTAPTGAVVARLYVWMEDMPGGPAAAAIEIDNVQFEQASAATPFGFPILLRGDRFSIGGQRVMVAADVTASDTGAANVSFLPAHRAGAASAAAVTLVKPTTKYVPTQPFVPMPANGNVLPGFGMEFVEE